MKRLVLVILSPMLAAGARDAPATAGSAQAGPPAFKLQMVDPAITKAVRETLAEQPAAPPAREGTALSGEAGAGFARRMDEAAVPSCWRPEALKLQPARIGPVGLGGLLALPFWGAALAGGKCKR